MRLPFRPVIVLALLAVPSLAAAQRPHALELGDRVRLRLAAPGSPALVGTITGLGDSSLTLRRAGSVSIEEDFSWAKGAPGETYAWRVLATVERSHGTHTLTLLGAVVGLATGLYIGEATSSQSVDTLGEGVLKAALLVGGGLVLGAAAGHAIRVERWRKVRTDTRLGMILEPGRASARIATRF